MASLPSVAAAAVAPGLVVVAVVAELLNSQL